MEQQHVRTHYGVTPLAIALVLLGAFAALIALIGLVLIIGGLVDPGPPGFGVSPIFEGLVMLVGFGAIGTICFRKSREYVRKESGTPNAADNVLLQMEYASTSLAEPIDVRATESAEVAKNDQLPHWWKRCVYLFWAAVLPFKAVEYAMKAAEDPTPRTLMLLAMFSVGCVFALWVLYTEFRSRRESRENDVDVDE